MCRCMFWRVCGGTVSSGSSYSAILISYLIFNDQKTKNFLKRVSYLKLGMKISKMGGEIF